MLYPSAPPVKRQDLALPLTPSREGREDLVPLPPLPLHLLERVRVRQRLGECKTHIPLIDRPSPDEGDHSRRSQERAEGDGVLSCPQPQ